MNITSINYTKTYNLGSYQSEKIGVEISINEGENAMEALDTVKKLCQEFHEKDFTDIQFAELKAMIETQLEEMKVA